jgi:hypothetical protein
LQNPGYLLGDEREAGDAIQSPDQLGAVRALQEIQIAEVPLRLGIEQPALLFQRKIGIGHGDGLADLIGRHQRDVVRLADTCIDSIGKSQFLRLVCRDTRCQVVRLLGTRSIGQSFCLGCRNMRKDREDRDDEESSVSAKRHRHKFRTSRSRSSRASHRYVPR